MSKEELKSVRNLLSTEGSLTAEPRSPVLLVNISVSNNTSTPSNTSNLEKIKSHDNSASSLDEEFLLF